MSVEPNPSRTPVDCTGVDGVARIFYCEREDGTQPEGPGFVLRLFEGPDNVGDFFEARFVEVGAEELQVVMMNHHYNAVFMKKGLPEAAILEAERNTNRVVVSSVNGPKVRLLNECQEPEAAKVWMRLVGRGLARVRGDGRYMLLKTSESTPTNVTVFLRSIGIPPSLWTSASDLHIFGESRGARPTHVPASYDEPRTCRVCSRTAPDATFARKAHLVPVGVGNRNLLASEECDECNSEFGDAGDREIVELVRPFRTLTGVKGRGGVGTFKDQRAGSEIRSSGANVLAASSWVTAAVVNEGFGYFDVEVSARVDFYAICRALARMALHVLSRNSVGYSSALRLVRGTSDVPSLGWVSYAGASTRDGYLRVLREPDLRGERYIVELMACSLGLLLPLPAGSWALANDMTLRQILGHGNGSSRHANVGFLARATPGIIGGFKAGIRIVNPTIHHDIRGPSTEPRAKRSPTNDVDAAPVVTTVTNLQQTTKAAEAADEPTDGVE